MRHIGTLPDENAARRFGDYLFAQGIQTDIEPGETGWSIWVHDEDSVAKAKEELGAFVGHPDDPRYTAAQAAAADLREQSIRRAVAARKNMVNVRDRWRQPASAASPITMCCIFISILVAIYTNLGSANEELIRKLQIAPLDERRIVPQPPLLQNVREGEVWRLVTPIFVHLGVMHIFFNMTMFYQFGTLIERRMGSGKFLLLVLLLAVVSNFAQFWFKSPYFGGMSGVLYGLFGFVWMKSRYDPGAGYYLTPGDVTVMMGWYLLCLFVLTDYIANWAHGAGLAAGMLIALTGTGLKSLTRGSGFQV